MLRASVVERLAIATASTALALLIGVTIVAAAGYDPVQFLVSLINGAVGGESAIARTLRFSTLFILTGVAVAVAFRAGVFNIGVQGQFVVGGIATVMSIIWTAPLLPEGTVGGAGLILIGFVAGTFAGGVYGALPGALKAYADANVIITTIMLNFIATGVVGWLVQNPFRGEGNAAPNTERIPEYVSFPSVVFDSSGFSVVGLAIALATVAVI
ncbi:ABC transporter permease, partial [Halorubrum sp. E3]